MQNNANVSKVPQTADVDMGEVGPDDASVSFSSAEEDAKHQFMHETDVTVASIYDVNADSCKFLFIFLWI